MQATCRLRVCRAATWQCQCRLSPAAEDHRRPGRRLSRGSTASAPMRASNRASLRCFPMPCGPPRGQARQHASLQRLIAARAHVSQQVQHPARCRAELCSPRSRLSLPSAAPVCAARHHSRSTAYGAASDTDTRRPDADRNSRSRSASACSSSTWGSPSSTVRAPGTASAHRNSANTRALASNTLPLSNEWAQVMQTCKDDMQGRGSRGHRMVPRGWRGQ